MAVKLWLPWPSAELVIVQLPAPSAVAVPSAVMPFVSKSVTVASASAPLPLTVGVVLLVRLSVVDRRCPTPRQVRRDRRRRRAVSIVTASRSRPHWCCRPRRSALAVKRVAALASADW